MRAFVGLVSYYRAMWTVQSYLIQPLTAITSTKVTFKWTDVEQKAFNTVKQIVARNTLLLYTVFNERFDIHTDVSNFQLGAVIIHNSKPIAFYRHKLTPLQSRYTVMEKELLSMVKILKEFRTILLYQRSKIYTNH